MELQIEFPYREVKQVAKAVFEDRFHQDSIARAMEGIVEKVINKYSR